MATPHGSRRGSMGYYPRKRAKKIVPTITTWPEGDDIIKLQGFAGYKCGMTHAVVIDWRKKSNTAGQEVTIPVTVLEVPPMKIAGIRLYEKTNYGLKVMLEYWATNLDKELGRKISLPVNTDRIKLDNLDKSRVEEVRVLAYTQPYLVSGLPKKKPELMEIRVGGGKIEDRIDYAIKALNKEITFKDFSKVGQFIDVISVTKGKGFQGHVKRFGVKLLPRKNRKHRRMVGTLGPWHPNFVMSTVPMAGQLGYQQRTEYNKRVVQFVDRNELDSSPIVPNGGFLNYGEVKNGYVLLHGSVPGPAKRLVRLRDPIRVVRPAVEEIKIVYLSRESKQGV